MSDGYENCKPWYVSHSTSDMTDCNREIRLRKMRPAGAGVYINMTDAAVIRSIGGGRWRVYFYNRNDRK